jgi:hypothetical protein
MTPLLIFAVPEIHEAPSTMKLPSIRDLVETGIDESAEPGS